MAFGKKLQEWLESRALTVSDAARMTGIPYTTIDSIIKRDSENIALTVALKISAGLGVTVDDIQGSLKNRIPQNENEAAEIAEQKRRELIADMRLLDSDEQDQIENMIRFFVKRREDQSPRKQKD